ncbi:L,D-transpeptidase family protein [Notoacmeibacter marinus]|uniref:L,D-transpeptidase family protein n=1 Tax=Notoacmeibacter marinus TaxID=1876515 RepID=UPI001FE17412|nr:L,D-transpeptidase family protein [Notoacmeibacter marinus]
MKRVNVPFTGARSCLAPLVVNRMSGSNHRGRLRLGSLSFPCALGRAGIVSRKREGDGGTPLGHHQILFGYRRSDRTWTQGGPLPLSPTRPADGWCDAPAHPAYNRPVRLPFPARCERMIRADRLYDCCIVLDYNYSSRARYRGSAIFFHLAERGYPPTEGCIALAPRDMARLLPYLKRGRTLIVQR